jgi:type II secretory pathway pseudopilin PulG
MRLIDLARWRRISMKKIVAAAVVIGIIAAIVVPRVAASRGEAKRQAHEEYKLQIDEAVERWYINENQWPATDLSDIGADSNYFPTGVPLNPISGRPYVLDPVTHRVE